MENKQTNKRCDFCRYNSLSFLFISNIVKYLTHSILIYIGPFQNLYIHLQLLLSKVNHLYKRTFTEIIFKEEEKDIYLQNLN